MSPAPAISVLTPVYDTDPDVLAECLGSVAAQTFTDWEHVLVDDASPGAHVWPQLLAASVEDPRRVVHRGERNEGIVGASNRALELARGRIVVLLDHDDLLAPQALERIAAAFDTEDDDVDYVYSDEDVLVDGERVDPFYKPDWSPERFRNQMYTCHISAFRTELMRSVGGFHQDAEGAQDWDLVLRVTEQARRIVHVPEVLYHWRVVPTSVLAGEDVKPYAYDAATRALAAHAERVGLDVEVVEQQPRGYFRLVRVHRHQPLVSIVIPTRCSARCGVGRRARDGARGGAQHRRTVVVDPAGGRAGGRPTRRGLGRRARPGDGRAGRPARRPSGRRRLGPPVQLLRQGQPRGPARHRDVLVLLNDDVEVVSPLLARPAGRDRPSSPTSVPRARCWSSTTAGSSTPRTGLRGRQPHAHRRTGPGGARERLRRGAARRPGGLGGDRGLPGHPARGVVGEVGGFEPRPSANFNDVDFCCKVREVGAPGSSRRPRRASTTSNRSAATRPWAEHELAALRRRWWPELTRDPYYNPNYGSSFDNYPFPLSYP